MDTSALIAGSAALLVGAGSGIVTSIGNKSNSENSRDLEKTLVQLISVVSILVRRVETLEKQASSGQTAMQQQQIGQLASQLSILQGQLAAEFEQREYPQYAPQQYEQPRHQQPEYPRPQRVPPSARVATAPRPSAPKGKIPPSSAKKQVNPPVRTQVPKPQTRARATPTQATYGQARAADMGHFDQGMGYQQGYGHAPVSQSTGYGHAPVSQATGYAESPQYNGGDNESNYADEPDEDLLSQLGP